MNRLKISIIAFLCSCLCAFTAFAQTADPSVTYTVTEIVNDVPTPRDEELKSGDEKTENAPLQIKMFANLEDNIGWDAKCEWKLYNTKDGESKPILDRFDENTTYTLESSGTYGIKLYVTFSKADEEDIEYESSEIKINITTSKLSCPDGFSPNNDGINDKFEVTYQSIVQMSGVIVNRWGQKIYSFDLSNVDKGWDGRQNGKYVKDGVYFLHLKATGSDGTKYDIKKAINVLKGWKDYDN
ncbi:MAG: gliding motility-associated C-terminal domain-containing protein [Bacteroidaceae bacterium]|nr:gliding motility-associated C-terminal domain-containing protein [Bacteroidaceae bacterium]